MCETRMVGPHVCFREHVSISQIFFLNVLLRLTNSPGRSELIHSEKRLNLSDWTRDTPRQQRLWGKALLATGMFYYLGPKIHSGLSFHLSEGAETRWLTRTVGGNNSPALLSRDRNICKTKPTRKHMKYLVQHNVAWHSDATSFLLAALGSQHKLSVWSLKGCADDYRSL